MQNKCKRENESIKDVVECMGLAVEERRDAIWKKLLSKSLNKETLEYFFVQTVILCDLPFNLVQNHTFHTWLKYVNSAANDLLPNSGSNIQDRIMSPYREKQYRIYLPWKLQGFCWQSLEQIQRQLAVSVQVRLGLGCPFRAPAVYLVRIWSSWGSERTYNAQVLLRRTLTLYPGRIGILRPRTGEFRTVGEESHGGRGWDGTPASHYHLRDRLALF